MTENETLRVGEREYVLRPFKGLKAVSLMDAVGGLMKVMPDIQDRIAAITKKHRDDNLMDWPRAAIELRYPEEAKNISDEAWNQNGGVVRLPDPDAALGWEQILLTILPQVMGEARDQVMDILALIVIPDVELMEADDAGDIETPVRAIGKQLLREGTLDELADLALKSVELIKNQFAGKVAELIAQVGEMFGADEAEEDEEPEIKVATVETPSENSDPEISNETSSTPSEPLTDGPDEKPLATAGTTSTDTSTE